SGRQVLLGGENLEQAVDAELYQQVPRRTGRAHHREATSGAPGAQRPDEQHPERDRVQVVDPAEVDRHVGRFGAVERLTKRRDRRQARAAGRAERGPPARRGEPRVARHAPTRRWRAPERVPSLPWRSVPTTLTTRSDPSETPQGPAVGD